MSYYTEDNLRNGPLDGSNNELSSYYERVFQHPFKPDFKRYINYESHSEHLVKHHQSKFNYWWDPDKFNWKMGSKSLAWRCHNLFNKWWTPDKFNWNDNAELAEYCYDNFNTWWDPNRFKWTPLACRNLAKYCSDKAHIWWNPKKFLPSEYESLMIYCRESLPFIQWWDPNLVPKMGISTFSSFIQFEKKNLNIWWPVCKPFIDKNLSSSLSLSLLKNMYDQFEEWWNPSKFQYTPGTCRFLSKKCEKHFDEWWNPDKFKFHSNLIHYCNNHFEKWWDSIKKNTREKGLRKCGSQLARYCSKHFDEWWNPDYLKYYTTDPVYTNLIKYCEQDFFKHWDLKLFPWKTHSTTLVKHAKHSFDEWYKPDLLCWEKISVEDLKNNFPDKESIWGPEFIYRRL